MVEWKKLDTLLDFEQPTPYLVKSTEYDDSYDTPVLTAGQSLLLGYTNETDGIYEASKENPCIIFDDFTTSFHWIDYNFKVKSSAMKMLRPKKDVNFRYVYYSMCGINFVPGGHQRHWISKYSQFEIPMPALLEQNRIVGILDTFTASIDNLKEQIAQRRRQYEYYCDQLLDLEGKEGVEMVKLEDVVSKECTLSYGIVQPGEDIFDGVPVVRPIDLITTYVYRHGLKNTTKDISDSYRRTILKGKEILFCVRGTTGIMSLATQELDGCNVTRGIVPISFDNEITKMFVYYQLRSRKLQKVIADKTNGTALKQINIKDLRQIKLLIPSLSEQQRIVDILDKFEASIQNLEAQLSQREKQYEYYRNKLLTFD